MSKAKETRISEQLNDILNGARNLPERRLGTGTFEKDIVKKQEMIGQFKKQYKRRLKLVCNYKLNGKNKIKVVNTVFRYGAGCVKFNVWLSKN